MIPRLRWRYFWLLFILLDISLWSRDTKIIVHPFIYESPQLKQYNWIATDLSDKISSILSGIERLKISSPEDRTRVLKEVGFIQKIGEYSEGNDYFSEIIKPDLILSGKVQIQNNMNTTTIRITNFKDSSSRLVRVSTGFTSSNLESYYNKVLIEILKELEKIEIDSVPILYLTEELKNSLKIKKLYNPEALELYYKGKSFSSEDFLRAEQYYLKAISLEPDFLEAIIALGSIYSLNKKNFSKADEEFGRALQLFQKLNESDTFRYYELLTLMASNYYLQGEYSDSLEYYYKAKVGLETLGLQDSFSMALLEYGIGICYSGMNQRQKAVVHFNNSKNIFNSLKISRSLGYANLLYGLGYVQLGLNEVSSALDNYKNSYKIYEELKQDESVTAANLLFSLGYIYEKKGNTAEASKQYRKALQIYEKIGYAGKETVSTRSALERVSP